MTRESKALLKIGLILYAIIMIIDILGLFNIEALEQVYKLSAISIPIGTMILLAYVLDKGEKGICLTGILCIVISIAISIIKAYNIIDFSYESEKTTIKQIIETVDFVASCGLYLCSMLAIFSLIPSNTKGSILKIFSILAYAVYVIGNVIIDYVDISNVDGLTFLINVESLGIYASHFAQYAFIVIYLLNKQVDLVKEIKQENPALQEKKKKMFEEENDQAGFEPATIQAELNQTSLDNQSITPVSNNGTIEPIANSGTIQPVSNTGTIEPIANSGTIQPISNTAPTEPEIQPNPVVPQPVEVTPVANEVQPVPPPVVETPPVPQPVVETSPMAQPVETPEEPAPAQNVIPQLVMPTTTPQP